MVFGLDSRLFLSSDDTAIGMADVRELAPSIIEQGTTE